MAKKKRSRVKDAPGMRGIRARIKSGLLRNKRDDTKLASLKKKYGFKFKLRKDIRLGTLLKKKRIKSLKKLSNRF